MKQHPTRLVLLVLTLVCLGCDQRARGLLTATSPQGVLEGQRTQVTITIRNVEEQPIVPLALSLYVRPDPTEYLVLRQTLGEVEYYKPLHATEVRHLQTLDRIEADHVRDGEEWRRVPDSRFLHPRILLPGQSLDETFEFQALASHRRLLYCDLYYLSGDALQGRLFVRKRPQVTPPDTDRYTEVYTRIAAADLDDPDPEPPNYLLYRPARIHDTPPQLLTHEVRLDVQPQAFTYRQAARRARLGARTSCYFSAAGAWLFEYGDDGTWFVRPEAVIRLNGRYAQLITELERRNATVLTLTAPRKPDDKLLQHLQKAGYSDPTSRGPNAVAVIPTDHLLPTLEQAEALGYLVEPTTWKPLP